MFNSLWYQNLVRPPLTPDAWIFQPVWTILYITIFAALIIYLIKKHDNKTAGYIYFGIQMILNIAWSPIFFGLKNIGLALITIVILDYYIFMTIREFYSVSKPAAVLLVPYQIWVLFATYLNAGYFALNM